MKIGFAQINATVGDISGNAEKIAAAYQELVRRGADLVITPELALCGYPPQDLVFKTRFVPECQEALSRLASDSSAVPLICGTVEANSSGRGRPFRNVAACLQSGRVVARVFKSLLPTYDVFNEARYFEPAEAVAPVDLAGRRVGVTICEDIWSEEFLPRPLYRESPLAILAPQCELLVNLSASPFEVGKPAARRRMIEAHAAQYRLPIAYCNTVGGNDRLVFDGHSLAVTPAGTLWRGPSFAEGADVVDFSEPPAPIAGRSDIEDLHDALVLGLRDYLSKCGFSSCLLGLSGGIDSAVTACLAVEAAGAGCVTGVLLPSPYSSLHSVEDASRLAEALGIRQLLLPIHEPFAAVKNQLREAFAGLPEDATEENIQARLRGLAL
ncbi:MAG: hypothetical protein N2322_02790, partial [Terrimicrobiaceae bacterium]|nr:hypothetical protein [Terrimicrobiaceae bacterium]